MRCNLDAEYGTTSLVVAPPASRWAEQPRCRTDPDLDDGPLRLVPPRRPRDRVCREGIVACKCSAAAETRTAVGTEPIPAVLSGPGIAVVDSMRRCRDRTTVLTVNPKEFQGCESRSGLGPRQGS
jgi:hypothetical protein